MTPEQGRDDLTKLLAASGKGDADAAAQLFPLVYKELHRLASGYMRQERADHTLQPTALVHEAFLRLFGGDADSGRFENREHFMATAALAMRHILVNHARAAKTQKRGGGRPLQILEDAVAAFDNSATDLIALDEALHRLAEKDKNQARLVEMRFFGGMTNDECAAVLGVSRRSIQYEWAHARAWLRGQLEGR
jgi:RNA polymerase sigma factor (TIGR02999 family)